MLTLLAISLFSKMGDNGGGRGKKSQKMGDVINGRPQTRNSRSVQYIISYPQIPV